MSRASRLKGRRGCLVATSELSGHLRRQKRPCIRCFFLKVASSRKTEDRRFVKPPVLSAFVAFHRVEAPAASERGLFSVTRSLSSGERNGHALHDVGWRWRAAFYSGVRRRIGPLLRLPGGW